MVVRRVTKRQLIGVVRKPSFWLLLVTLALITVPHYGDAFEHPWFVARFWENFGLDRHAFERILYLAPIVWAGFLFGQRGSFLVSLLSVAIMLPRDFIFSEYRTDAIFETIAVFVIGNVVAFTFGALRKERERRIELSVLNDISGVISKSLELNRVLTSSLESVVSVMKVDAALVFLLDEKAGELSAAAYEGVSERFIRSIGGIKLGEGFNGRVAQTGEPLIVDDVSQDVGATKRAVMKEGIKSQLIVPLASKGRVVGTLCAAMRQPHQFSHEEVELLTAIGNQIGVAVENARLYEHEREITRQLRTSEERFRQLFESANDAIWVHDLEGNILAANNASLKLIGYSLEELFQMSTPNVRVFLSDEGLSHARELGRKLLNNEPVAQPYELRIIRKDGTEATLMMATNLVAESGKPVAFQHIARDVTEEKRMKENLRFYLQQITRAQEEERRRIARELHDDTIQYLVVLARQLDDLATSNKSMSQEDRASLESLRQQTTSIIEGVRHLSHDLRPATLDRLGLVAALEWLASSMEKLSGIAVKVKKSGAERRLPAEVELVMFRIAQEALSNVRRHSQATEAEVIVELNEKEARIIIRDNGKGFALPDRVGDLLKEGRLGLAGMQERIQLLNGNLKIESAPGTGTTVTVEAPIQSP